MNVGVCLTHREIIRASLRQTNGGKNGLRNGKLNFTSFHRNKCILVPSMVTCIYTVVVWLVQCTVSD